MPFYCTCSLLNYTLFDTGQTGEFKMEGVHCQWKEWLWRLSFTFKSYPQCFANGHGSQALTQSLLLLTGHI